jgi:hypothetical protein
MWKSDRYLATMCLGVFLASVAGCGTSSGGGGGSLYVPADTQGNTLVDTVAGDPSDADTTGQPGTDAVATDTFVAPADNPQENALYTGLGLSPLGAAGNFSGTIAPGTWIVNFSNWASHKQGKVTLGPRSARIDFDAYVSHTYDPSCSDYTCCDAKRTESIFVEMAESGDIAYGWEQDNVEPAGCNSEPTKQTVHLLFAMRRVNWSTGMFGALSGQWDVFPTTKRTPSSLGCRIQLDQQGLTGCLDQIQWKVQASAVGDQVSGSFNVTGEVQFTAQHTDGTTTPLGFGMPALVVKPMDFGSYTGNWDVAFANWSGETTGAAAFAGRVGKVALAGGSTKCGVGARTYIAEFAGSGELGFLWLEQVPAAGCSGKPTIELIKTIRRTSSGNGGEFTAIAGMLEVRESKDNIDNDPLTTCALTVDGTGLHGCGSGFTLISASEASDVISGSWVGISDFTAFRQGKGPVCGNGTCDKGESTDSCPADCKVATTCGNGVCDLGETNATCSLDCVITTNCGNGKCESGETSASCPSDCGAVYGCKGHCAGSSKTLGGAICWCDDSCANQSTPDCCSDKVSYCGGAGCGDGICAANESQFSCPSDCTANPGCTSNSDCGSTEVCQNSNCANASGLAYVLTINTITASTTNSIGDAWDVGGGAPDAYVVVKVDGVTKCTTTVQADTFAGVWFADCSPIVLYSFNTVEIDVYDQDVTTDDFMDGTQWTNFTSVVHAGTFNSYLYGGLVKIWFDVTAK